MRTPKFLGVYSERTRVHGKTAPRVFHFIWKQADGSYIAQKLDRSLTPVAKPRVLTDSQLNSGYKFEPTMLAAPIASPDLRTIRPSAQASQVSELTDDTLAQLEKSRKIKQVENDLRASFDKAIRALNRPRDRRGAMIALEQIALATDGIVPAHKYMYRDFGVALRKKSLPELALKCAKRTVELAPDDDHAHFNIARILEILERYEDADSHLRKAIEIDPNERIYRKFQDYLARKR